MLKVLNDFDSWQAAAVSALIAGVATAWTVRRHRRSRHHFGLVGTSIFAVLVFAVLFTIVFFAFI
jgi:nicotinamide riboside transporter PnuC